MLTKFIPVAVLAACAIAQPPAAFNIKTYGAKGDGVPRSTPPPSRVAKIDHRDF
jgi:hypothetical protein